MGVCTLLGSGQTLTVPQESAVKASSLSEAKNTGCDARRADRARGFRRTSKLLFELVRLTLPPHRTLRVSEGSKTSWGERKPRDLRGLAFEKRGVGEKPVPLEEVMGIRARYRTSGESVFTQLKNY